MRSPSWTSGIGIAALWRARRLRRAGATLGVLGLLVQALLTALHQPAVAAPGTSRGLVLCHAGTVAPTGKPGGGPAKGPLCPLCVALALSGSVVMPDSAALRPPPALAARAPIEPGRGRVTLFGRAAAQPRGPPPAA